MGCCDACGRKAETFLLDHDNMIEVCVDTQACNEELALQAEEWEAEEAWSDDQMNNQ